MVKTSLVAPACCSKEQNSTFGLTWKHKQDTVRFHSKHLRVNSSKENCNQLLSPVCFHLWCLCGAPRQLTLWSCLFLHTNTEQTTEKLNTGPDDCRVRAGERPPILLRFTHIGWFWLAETVSTQQNGFSLEHCVQTELWVTWLKTEIYRLTTQSKIKR